MDFVNESKEIRLNLIKIRWRDQYIGVMALLIKIEISIQVLESFMCELMDKRVMILFLFTTGGNNYRKISTSQFQDAELLLPICIT